VIFIALALLLWLCYNCLKLKQVELDSLLNGIIVVLKP